MDMVERPINLYSLLKWAGALALAYWAKVPYLVQILVAFMAIDMLTGALAAFIEKKLCSDLGARGLAKKALMLLLVLAAHILSDSDPLHLGLDVSNVVAIGFIANEIISIVENCARAGVPVPTPLVEALLRFQGQNRVEAKKEQGQ